jgi:hypothetical protein
MAVRTAERNGFQIRRSVNRWPPIENTTLLGLVASVALGEGVAAARALAPRPSRCASRWADSIPGTCALSSGHCAPAQPAPDNARDEARREVGFVAFERGASGQDPTCRTLAYPPANSGGPVQLVQLAAGDRMTVLLTLPREDPAVLPPKVQYTSFRLEALPDGFEVVAHATGRHADLRADRQREHGLHGATTWAAGCRMTGRRGAEAR